MTLPVPDVAATPPNDPPNARQRAAASAAHSTDKLASTLRAWVWPYRILVDLTDKTIVGGAAMTALFGVVGIVLALATGSVVLGVLNFVGWIIWAVAVIAVGRWWWTYRTSTRRDRHLLLARPGFATVEEIIRTVGPEAVVKKAAQVRPGLTARLRELGRAVAPSDMGWLVGIARSVRVWAMVEIPLYLVGPARSGKGFGLLIAAIMEAPGSVVTTSTRADNMEATIAARAKLGPVYLFDPEGVSGRVTTLRWSLLAGCEDPAVAQRRAATLVGKVGLEGDNQVWASSAGGIVQCLLHAAAVSGRRVSDLHRWSTSPTAAYEVIALLEQYSPESNWSETIQAIQDEEHKMRANKWFGVESAFKALDVASVRKVFDVDPAETFDPEEFLRARGTLYMVSPWRDTASTGASVGAFFSLVLDDIARAVRTLSQHPANSGRQDPPCDMVLDELANIHPWGGLPLAMTAGSGEGLRVTAAFQSRSQARAAYGTDVERTMWENATTLLLGAGKDTSDHKELSDLLGERTVTSKTTNWGGGMGGLLAASSTDAERETTLVSVDELRRLPESVVLMVQGRARPIVVTTVPWPKRDWADQVAASKAWHEANPRGMDGSLAPTYTHELAA